MWFGLIQCNILALHKNTNALYCVMIRGIFDCHHHRILFDILFLLSVLGLALSFWWGVRFPKINKTTYRRFYCESFFSDGLHGEYNARTHAVGSMNRTNKIRRLMEFLPEQSDMMPETISNINLDILARWIINKTVRGLDFFVLCLSPHRCHSSSIVFICGFVLWIVATHCAPSYLLCSIEAWLRLRVYLLVSNDDGSGCRNNNKILSFNARLPHAALFPTCHCNRVPLHPPQQYGHHFDCLFHRRCM